MGAAAKGRSSSQLNQLLRKAAALELAGELQVYLVLVPSAENAADRPSRGARHRTVSESGIIVPPSSAQLDEAGMGGCRSETHGHLLPYFDASGMMCMGQCTDLLQPVEFGFHTYSIVWKPASHVHPLLPGLRAESVAVGMPRCFCTLGVHIEWCKMNLFDWCAFWAWCFSHWRSFKGFHVLATLIPLRHQRQSNNWRPQPQRSQAGPVLCGWVWIAAASAARA